MEKKNELMYHHVDQLLGFNLRQLQVEMTEGLAEWMERKQEYGHTLRYSAVVVAVIACLAMHACKNSPKNPYRIAAGTSYPEAIALTQNLLTR